MNKWERKRIGDLCEVGDGNHSSKYPKSKEFLTHGVPFIRSVNLIHGKVSGKEMRFISPEKHKSLKKGHLRQGDILFTNRGQIGKMAIVDKNYHGANLNSQTAWLRCNEQIDNRYLYYQLSSQLIQNLTLGNTNGTALQQLTIAELKNIKIPLPPKNVQLKIADILSTVDSKIEVIDHQFNETKRLKEGLLQRMFKKGIGHTEFKDSPLGKIPKTWNVFKLSDLTDEITDYVAAGSFSALKENVCVSSEPDYAIYVRLTDLRKGLGHSEQKYVDKGSYEFLTKSNLYGREILFANIGANVGEVWMMPQINGRATIAPNMIIIRANNLNVFPEYLHSYFNSAIGLRQIDKIIAGSGHPKINKTELRSLLALVPPIEEQKKIADIINCIDGKLNILHQRKAIFYDLKKGLMQQLLTNKLRVNNLIEV